MVFSGLSDHINDLTNVTVSHCFIQMQMPHLESTLCQLFSAQANGKMGNNWSSQSRNKGAVDCTNYLQPLKMAEIVINDRDFYMVQSVWVYTLKQGVLCLEMAKTYESFELQSMLLLNISYLF